MRSIFENVSTMCQRRLCFSETAVRKKQVYFIFTILSSWGKFQTFASAHQFARCWS
uniref:Uncharacterized protein n=1 Tax=Anticarsia gemmatalis multiple nucleopolyhedrovirus TaxID=268591 RepID=A0A0S3J0S9_9ABAC|nr:hypothetical protein AGNV_042 [Anticarsia gemmatalis multiple nucleopolyhedrovirus]